MPTDFRAHLPSMRLVCAQITIFDHRGCARKGGEYKGELSGSQDDEMLVKVAQTQLKIDNPAFKELAASVLQASHRALFVFLLFQYGLFVIVAWPPVIVSCHHARWHWPPVCIATSASKLVLAWFLAW